MEPTAPASVGEATPKKIDPRTRKTSKKGGKRYLTPSTRDSLVNSFRCSSGGRPGPILGLTAVLIRM